MPELGSATSSPRSSGFEVTTKRTATAGHPTRNSDPIRGSLIHIAQRDSSDSILTLDATPGQLLTFDANGSSDPDGDPLSYSWWFYPEAGRQPYGQALPIEDSTTERISVAIPADAVGKELHLILEVIDQGKNVSLVDYRRVVITVAAAP